MSPSVLDDMLQVKGALGATVVAFGGIISYLIRRIGQLETDKDHLREKITEVQHALELTSQRLTIMFDNLSKRSE
jgi:hypothetical protein